MYYFENGVIEYGVNIKFGIVVYGVKSFIIILYSIFYVFDFFNEGCLITFLVVEDSREYEIFLMKKECFSIVR